MNLIVIADRRWGIGKDGRQPFFLKEDLRRFRELTLGGCVIMGRRTLEGLPGGRPLSGRRNLVLSRTPGFVPEGAEVCRSPEQAAALDIPALARFLASPLAERIRTAPQVWREYRFALLTDAGIYDVAAAGEEILLQGVADCVFETTAGLTVVDFKTDRVTAAEASQRAEAYRPQLDAYAGALSRILEKPVTERILYFFACGEEISL